MPAAYRFVAMLPAMIIFKHVFNFAKPLDCNLYFIGLLKFLPSQTVMLMVIQSIYFLLLTISQLIIHSLSASIRVHPCCASYKFICVYPSSSVLCFF